MLLRLGMILLRSACEVVDLGEKSSDVDAMEPADLKVKFRN